MQLTAHDTVDGFGKSSLVNGKLDLFPFNHSIAALYLGTSLGSCPRFSNNDLYPQTLPKTHSSK